MLDKIRKNKKIQSFFAKIQQPHIMIASIIILVILANIFTDNSYEAVSVSMVNELKNNSFKCRHSKIPIKVKTNNLEIVEFLSYDYQGLYALGFEVKNVSNENIVVNAEILEQPLKTESLLVDITEKLLPPGESVKAYVVYKNRKTIRNLQKI